MEELSDEFKQKKRSRAINITDVAIDKIPITNIFGFNSEQNKYIQNLHKSILKENCP